MKFIIKASELRPRLIKYMQENPSTFKEMAKEIGISEGTLKRMLQDEMTEVQSKVSLLMDKFLREKGF